MASQFEPDFRFRLGYFYSAFRGIHENYLRHLHFVEREVLPRVEAGPDAFYDETGRFDQGVRVRMALIEEFAPTSRDSAGWPASWRTNSRRR